MTKRTKRATVGFALCWLFTMSFSAANAGDPYPLEYFALREVVSNVELLPDGNRVAMLKILSRDGNPILHIYNTADLSADPFVVDSDPMELIGYGWLSDTVIVIELRQKVRNRIEGQNQGVYEYKIAKLDLKREKFEEFEVPSPNVENIVRNKANKIIISSQPGADDSPGLPEAFRPRAYYMMDLRKGTRQLLIRGKISLAQIEFDADGDPWLARGFEAAESEFVWYYRPKGGKGWDPIFRLDEYSFEDFTVLGKDPAVPGNLLVRANNGHDIMGLWSYSTEKKSFDELIYRRSDVDVYGVRLHSNRWQYPDLITAVSYYKDKLHYEYFDDIEGATYGQLEKLIPHAHYVAIQSRSRDGNTFTVFNQGPRDPGTYYLYKEGSFSTLGSQQPLIDSEELADLRYIRYRARDGRKIAALLTVPNGEGPFPLIVLPHGGPFVQEIVVYDEWAQMLANNGYLVV